MYADKDEIFDTLRSMGATHVDVSYSGSSDEGWVDEPIVYKGDEVIAKRAGYRGDGGVGYGSDGQPHPVIEQIEELVYNNLPGGWEINEGSHGSVRLDVATRKARFDHVEYVEQASPFEV